MSTTTADMTAMNHVRLGSGEPLVLVHGIGSQWRIWEPVLERLAAERDVIAVDLPGFGHTPPDGTGPTIVDQARRMRRFFDEVGVQRPHVAGNSMGGAIALELARAGAVASATAVSPAGFWTTRERRFAQISLRTARRLLPHLAPVLPAMLQSRIGRAALLGQLVGRPWLMDPAAAADHLQLLLRAPAFDACLSAFDGYTFHDAEQLEPIPITIAWGDRDFLLLHRQADRARRVLPLAKHVTLTGCGHAPFSDDPELVADVLLTGSRAATLTG